MQSEHIIPCRKRFFILSHIYFSNFCLLAIVLLRAVTVNSVSLFLSPGLFSSAKSPQILQINPHRMGAPGPLCLILLNNFIFNQVCCKIWHPELDSEVEIGSDQHGTEEDFSFFWIFYFYTHSLRLHQSGQKLCSHGWVILRSLSVLTLRNTCFEDYMNDFICILLKFDLANLGPWFHLVDG